MLCIEVNLISKTLAFNTESSNYAKTKQTLYNKFSHTFSSTCCILGEGLAYLCLFASCLDGKEEGDTEVFWGDANGDLCFLLRPRSKSTSLTRLIRRELSNYFSKSQWKTFWYIVRLVKDQATTTTNMTKHCRHVSYASLTYIKLSSFSLNCVVKPQNKHC